MKCEGLQCCHRCKNPRLLRSPTCSGSASIALAVGRRGQHRFPRGRVSSPATVQLLSYADLRTQVLSHSSILPRDGVSVSNDGKPKKKKSQKHTTGGIPRWSPTLVLVARFSAYVWQSGRDTQFSLTYGRMYQVALSSLYGKKTSRQYRAQRAKKTNFPPTTTTNDYPSEPTSQSSETAPPSSKPCPHSTGPSPF